MNDFDRTVDLEADDTADLGLTEAPTPPPAWERAEWRKGPSRGLDNEEPTD